MAQWAQLQPQLDFPFFLSFTNFRMMSTTTRSNTAEIRIVPIFSVIAAVIVLAAIIYMLVRPYKEATKLTTKVEM